MSSQVQLVEPSFTPEQQREIALHYAGLKKGQKAGYAKSLGLSTYRIRSWIAALADGDLDTGRFPRKTGTMTDRDVAEIARLRKQLEAKERQMHKALAEKDAKIADLEKARDALGKAISVLHALGEPRGVEDGA